MVWTTYNIDQIFREWAKLTAETRVSTKGANVFGSMEKEEKNI